MRNTAKMPRSTGSPAQAAAGGGSPHTAPGPKKAVTAIQRFFAGNFESLMLLQFLLETSTIFTLQKYKKASLITLPEDQLTAEIVVTWLLTLLFRNPAPGEAVVTDQVWHRVLVFFRENHECEELRLLFEFLKKIQHQIYSSNVIPRWVQIVLCPICDLDARMLSDLMKQEFMQPHSFWQNILQGLSLSLLPFWLNEQADCVMHYLIYELLQQPLLPTTRVIIQTLLHEKPLEFFSNMPANLLIFLSHYGLIPDSIVVKTLFHESRKFFTRLPKVFLYDDESMQNEICQAFFRKNFPSIYAFLSRTPSFGMSFNDTFVYPHRFFKKIIGTPNLLETSGIQIHEMRKYLSLFCWNQYTFFPSSLNNSHFFNQIMLLSDNWKFLFVQLWRIDTNYVSDFHIFALLKFVRQQTKCFFNKQLVDLFKIFMQQVVEKAPLKDKLTFFKWLLEQDITVLAHFQLTPELVQFCLTNFPNPSIKKTLFWWLFIVHSSLNYQRPERDLEINMDEVCQMMGLEISEEELGLTRSRETLIQKIGALTPLFNVITLMFKFGSFTSRHNFTSQTHCDHLSLNGLHPFRVLVYGIKSSLNLHLKPNGSCDRIRTLVTMCEEKRELLLQMNEEDRKFLKALFGSYFRKLVMSEELVQLLHRLSQVFPGDVKQHMFEACLQLKMLDVEKAGRKRSRDLTDPDSYEADCSMCRRPYPLPQLGLNAHGDPICRVCSQRFGIEIQTMLSGLPFARSGA
jgi:hypothetical protein